MSFIEFSATHGKKCFSSLSCNLILTESVFSSNTSSLQILLIISFIASIIYSNHCHKLKKHYSLLTGNWKYTSSQHLAGDIILKWPNLKVSTGIMKLCVLWRPHFTGDTHCWIIFVRVKSWLGPNFNQWRARTSFPNEWSNKNKRELVMVHLHKIKCSIHNLNHPLVAVFPPALSPKALCYWGQQLCALLYSLQAVWQPGRWEDLLQWLAFVRHWHQSHSVIIWSRHFEGGSGVPNCP